MFGPRQQIWGGESIKESLLFIECGVGGIDPVAIVEDACFRISVPAGEYRVSCKRLGDVVVPASKGVLDGRGRWKDSKEGLKNEAHFLTREQTHR